MREHAPHRSAPARSAPLDSLRALAALAVLGIHIGHFSGANLAASYGAFTSHLNVGVTLFFLITAFLLYRPWAVALFRERPAPRLAQYAKRRVLRVVPAYWVALTLLALWPGLTGVFGPDWWVYYGFAQSYRFDWTFRGLAPAWSLSVEMHYYALLPLYAWAIEGLARGRAPEARLRIAAAGVAALALVGLAFSFELTRRESLFWSAGLPAFLHWFAVGMALALLAAWSEGRESRAPVIGLVRTHADACWALAAAIYVGLCLFPDLPRAMSGRPYSAPERLLETVGYAAVAALVMLPAVFGTGASGVARRVLASRPLAALGTASYGVFLWHHPLLAEMRRRGLDQWIPDWPFLSLALPILPAAVACGVLSYLAIERPAIRWSRR